jgi:hypothetical protein
VGETQAYHRSVDGSTDPWYSDGMTTPMPKGPRYTCGQCSEDFLNYNRPRTIDGQPACERCDNATRNGVDIVTDLLYPGFKSIRVAR